MGPARAERAEGAEVRGGGPGAHAFPPARIPRWAKFGDWTPELGSRRKAGVGAGAGAAVRPTSWLLGCELQRAEAGLQPHGWGLAP